MYKFSKLYSIPFGQNFLTTLADFYIEQIHASITETSCSLLAPSKVKILLPSNRAVLNFQQALRKASGQHACSTLVFPTLYSLSHLHEKHPFELLSIYEINEKYTVLSDLDIVSLVLMYLPSQLSVNKSIALAKYLCELFNLLTTGGIEVVQLQELLLEDRLFNEAEHIKQSKQYLEILTERLPEYLKRANSITRSQRTVMVTQALNTYLQDTVVEDIMIIAGSTGTVPSTRQLMQTFKQLPNGMIVLPGYDVQQLCVEQCDQRVSQMATHPQHTMHHLCKALQVPTKDVEVINVNEASFTQLQQERSHLIRNAFESPPILPVEQHQLIQPPLMFEVETIQDEARLIAKLCDTILKEQHLNQENGQQDIAIVTPNLALTSRLISELNHLGLTANLSQGMSFQTTAVGSFVFLFAKLLREPTMQNFFHLAKHPLAAKESRQAHLSEIRDLEKDMRSFPLKSITIPFFKTIQTCLLERQTISSWSAFLAFFRTWCKNLSCQFLFNETSTKSDVVAAISFFDDLLRAKVPISQNFEDALLMFIDEFAPTVQFDEDLSSHIRILGALEARFTTADYVICASLNEGVWPKYPDIDPYLSNQMRLSLGLPSLKRQQGLAAHDLCTLFYAPNVCLTRALRDDSEVTLPSRIWTRFYESLHPFHADYKALALTLLSNAEVEDERQKDDSLGAIEPPAPCPPVSLRPTSYSASDVDLLMKNPYGFYIKRLLKIRPLETLVRSLDAREKGKLFHLILDSYLKEHDAYTLPNLVTHSKKVFDTFEGQQQNFLTNFQVKHGMKETFWWYRFNAIAKWWHNKLDTEPVTHRVTEIKGEIVCDVVAGPPFTLMSRADRLEIVHEPDKDTLPILRLIDYKTGQLPTKTMIKCGKAPQILVEAIIASEGGFCDTFRIEGTYSCEYWRLTGADPAGECLIFPLSMQDVKFHKNALLQALVYYHQSTTPYLCNPLNEADVLFSRMDEWAHLIDG